MILRRDPPLHLTYCLNVHPGETWAENFAAVREKALRVKELVGRPGPFGLGLRLGRTAAETLADPAVIAEFRAFCDANELYVFTINGFPYGPFHGTAVKENVYRPDWREPERLAYTNQLTDILAALLPEGTRGSISTLPGSYKEWIKTEADVRTMSENMADAAFHASNVRERTGRDIAIAIEPEPDCFIETTSETIAFFNGPLKSFGIRRLQETHTMTENDAEALLTRHLGVCFDTAHMAVEFEDLATSLSQLRDAGIRVAKIHLSAALSVREGADASTALEAFSEKVYLHQTRRKSPAGATAAFPDLPAALASPAGRDDKWRVHFHVPLFFEESGDLRSTRSLFTPRVIELIDSGITEHVEIETYTFGVLPKALAVADVADGIAREYKWVLEQFQRARMTFFRYSFLNKLRDELGLTMTFQKVTLFHFLYLLIPAVGIGVGITTHSLLVKIVGCVIGIVIGLFLASLLPRLLWNMLRVFVRKGWFLQPELPRIMPVMTSDEYIRRSKTLRQAERWRFLIMTIVLIPLAFGLWRFCPCLDRHPIWVQILLGPGMLIFIAGVLIMNWQTRKRFVRNLGLECPACGREITDTAGLSGVPHMGLCRHCGTKVIET